MISTTDTLTDVDGPNENIDILIDTNRFTKKYRMSNLKKYIKDKNKKPSFFNDNKNIINNLIMPQNIKVKKIKNKRRNDILQSIFNIYKFNNDFILNLLLLYKNKKLTYSKLRCLLTEENNTIIITDEMYDLALKNKNYRALNILFENEIFVEEKYALKRIIKYNLIENSVKTKNYNFVKKILSYKDFNFKNLKYEKILITAIKNSKTINSTFSDNKIAKLLIKSLLKSPYSNCTYKSLLLNIAIKNGNFDLVKYLIENFYFKYTKEEINSIDLKGQYPIIEAISNKNIEIFNYLLEKGADYNTINNYGVPLLFYALHLNDIEYIISLVNDKTRNKIDVNILDNNGYTPLIISYINKYMDIFNYLIEYSYINQIDKHGHSILYYVIKNKDSTNVKYLISIGAKIDEDIMNAAINISFSYNIISYILDNDNISLYYLNGENGEKEPLLNKIILHWNAFSKDLCEQLLIKGCDANAKDKKGNTPLICAVKKRAIEAIELLIKYGAIKNLENTYGKKAIHYNQSCYSTYHKIQSLLDENSF